MGVQASKDLHIIGKLITYMYNLASNCELSCTALSTSAWVVRTRAQSAHTSLLTPIKRKRHYWLRSSNVEIATTDLTLQSGLDFRGDQVTGSWIPLCRHVTRFGAWPPTAIFSDMRWVSVPVMATKNWIESFFLQILGVLFIFCIEILCHNNIM